jgi:hypothetical protein
MAIPEASNRSKVNSYNSELQGMCEVFVCPPAATGDDEGMCPMNISDTFEESGDVEVLDGVTNVFQTLPWESLKPGDICRMHCRDRIPADFLLLWSSAQGNANIVIPWVGGESAMVLRQVASLPADCAVSSLGTGVTIPPGTGGRCNPVDTFRRCGSFQVSPASPELDRLVVHFISSDPDRGWSSCGSRSLLPRNSELVMTDRVIGIVLHVGDDTKFAKNNGWSHSRCSVVAPPPTMATSSSQVPRAVPPLVDATEFERETSICWTDRFQDVEDDGNCLMTAFWLGLRTLLQLYPWLSATASEQVAQSSTKFREAALDAIFADPNYIHCLENQLQLWMELDASVLMSSMEDFFLLPESLQEHLLCVNQSCQYQGIPANMEDLVNRYKEALRTSGHVNGRDVFVPLGQLEIEALCEVFQVRMQVMKSESLTCFGPLAELDPRRIPSSLILDRSRHHKRMVRLLNVNSNHYNVHLPRRHP